MQTKWYGLRALFVRKSQLVAESSISLRFIYNCYQQEDLFFEILVIARDYSIFIWLVATHRLIVFLVFFVIVKTNVYISNGLARICVSDTNCEELSLLRRNNYMLCYHMAPPIRRNNPNIHIGYI